MQNQKYKFLKHTADIKFQAYGKTLEKAFENSAMALKEIIIGKLKIKSKIKKQIKVNALDYESLLQKFLTEFLYILDAENFIFSKVKVRIKEKELEANITGDKASNYNFTNSVKATTYSEIFVKKEKGIWVCQIVLDV
ncbi:MAG: archease [Nanoarchaeota archaeon]